MASTLSCELGGKSGVGKAWSSQQLGQVPQSALVKNSSCDPNVETWQLSDRFRLHKIRLEKAS